MYREIKKKILILKNRRPYVKESAAYIEEMNRVDWISSCLRLSGTSILRDSVQKIVQGELLVDVSLKNHQLIHRYVEMIKKIYSVTEMGTELTEEGLIWCYNILFEQEDFPYRENNPVLVEWNYNPPHFNEIKEQIEIVFQWLTTEKNTVNPSINPILRAVMLHNKIVEIYPFAEHSATMARIAMLYELIREGFPPIRLLMSEQEYNDAIVLYLKKEDCRLLYESVEHGIYNQLELMIQLTSTS